MAREQRRIARPIAQRGDADDDLGKAIIEILAEAGGGDHRVKILMGGADDTRVDRDRLAPADPLDHSFLQEAQQLYLQGQRNVADLVQEQGTALRLLDLARGGLDRAGESALFMTKQF